MCVYYSEINFFLKVNSAHTIEKEHSFSKDKRSGLQGDQLLTNFKLEEVSPAHYVHLKASCGLAERTPPVHLFFCAVAL